MYEKMLGGCMFEDAVLDLLQASKFQNLILI